MARLFFENQWVALLNSVGYSTSSNRRETADLNGNGPVT